MHNMSREQLLTYRKKDKSPQFVIPSKIENDVTQS